jgi:hypothetical protein
LSFDSLLGGPSPNPRIIRAAYFESEARCQLPKGRPVGAGRSRRIRGAHAACALASPERRQHQHPRRRIKPPRRPRLSNCSSKMVPSQALLRLSKPAPISIFYKRALLRAP